MTIEADTKQAYQEKAKAQLDKLNAQMDELKARSAQAKAEVRDYSAVQRRSLL
ncbi:hypothetical protein H1P_2200009 [Hyella patelloides LEGE 07179]|uniref:Uncharacterized protein n=1 Tax=Hyella patelloides LEGE 07179 TaxID=945734 RepID=A0A563VR13_9CYAN|nr:hypothetical protein [Hyella patelloides]VEP13829.1 hypothetical protein H1P_2200009 [Hyella patelloides LEGE 07179]